MWPELVGKMLRGAESTSDVNNHEMPKTPICPVWWLPPAAHVCPGADSKTLHWKILLRVRFCQTDAT